jgi:hypothetical protein
MKSIFYILAILLSFSSIAFSQPAISGVPDTLDYGCISWRSNPYRSFTIYNIGDQPLLFLNSGSPSGAVTPNPPFGPINPGDSAVYEIRYDTNRLGTFCETVEIKTNIPNSPDSVIIVKVMGEVKEMTSVLDYEQYSFQVYPTLVDDFLYIETNAPLSEEYSYTIINMEGKVVQSSNGLLNSIYLSNLTSNVYAISIYRKHQILHSAKFVKQ